MPAAAAVPTTMPTLPAADVPHVVLRSVVEAQGKMVEQQAKLLEILGTGSSPTVAQNGADGMGGTAEAGGSSAPAADVPAR